MLLRKQKMESIGNLTSGLAHDFCNFVSVILGKAGMLRAKLPDDPGLIGELEDVEATAKRAPARSTGKSSDGRTRKSPSS